MSSKGSSSAQGEDEAIGNVSKKLFVAEARGSTELVKKSVAKRAAFDLTSKREVRGPSGKKVSSWFRKMQATRRARAHHNRQSCAIKSAAKRRGANLASDEELEDPTAVLAKDWERQGDESEWKAVVENEARRPKTQRTSKYNCRGAVKKTRGRWRNNKRRNRKAGVPLERRKRTPLGKVVPRAVAKATGRSQ